MKYFELLRKNATIRYVAWCATKIDNETDRQKPDNSDDLEERENLLLSITEDRQNDILDHRWL